MIVDINDIFPNEISDETAHCLVNFFMDMALALESHYYGQIARYAKDNEPPFISPDFLKKSPLLNDNPPDELDPDENDF
jgi:hypothetical protein